MRKAQNITRSFRRLDLVALAGLSSGALGAALFKFGPDYLPAWLAWLLAPLFWYVGFGFVLAWALLRFLSSGGPDSDHSKIREWMREKLIEAAGTLFAEVGFDHAAVREICSRAGAHTTAVEDHFGSKMDLYTEVLRTPLFAQQAALKSSLAPSSDPRVAIQKLIYEWLERTSVGSGPAWFPLVMSREMTKPTQALESAAESMGPNYLRFRTLVGELIKQDANDARTRMCVHSIVGQVLHYMQSRPMIERLWPGLDLENEAQRRAIAGHIVTFSLAGMETIARQQFEATEGELK